MVERGGVDDWERLPLVEAQLRSAVEEVVASSVHVASLHARLTDEPRRRRGLPLSRRDAAGMRLRR